MQTIGGDVNEVERDSASWSGRIAEREKEHPPEWGSRLRGKGDNKRENIPLVAAAVKLWAG